MKELMEALDKDIDVPSKSARDHIHNVVAANAYDKGYETGRAEDVEAIPISWIEAYADWLTTIPAPFAVNDEKSIRAMLTKWRTNPDLQKIGCNKDYCDL